MRFLLFLFILLSTTPLIMAYDQKSMCSSAKQCLKLDIAGCSLVRSLFDVRVSCVSSCYYDFNKTSEYVMVSLLLCCFFFQAEDGIRDLVRSRGLGDVYKRQGTDLPRRLRQLRGH